MKASSSVPSTIGDTYVDPSAAPTGYEEGVIPNAEMVTWAVFEYR